MYVLDRWVFVLDQLVFVLDYRAFVLDYRAFVLDLWVFVLDHRVFVFGSSLSTHPVELYCVIVIKQVAFFTIYATLTMAFTFTSLPLNFCTSVSGCGCGFGFEQIDRLTDRQIEPKKRHGSVDLHTSFHSPLHWIKFM